MPESEIRLLLDGIAWLWVAGTDLFEKVMFSIKLNKLNLERVEWKYIWDAID